MSFILNFIKSIINVFLSVYDSLIDLIVNIPKYIAEAVGSASGVFNIFSAFFANIPDKLWLGILLGALGIFLMRFLYGNLNNSKGGA